MAETTRLSLLETLPERFLDCSAHDLHQILDGPTLIELRGEREPPLFVSILLHGNEDSGLAAIQTVIRSYHGASFPRSLMLLVGNVEAARRGVRRLETQPDYNRIWPGAADERGTVEAEVMKQVHARVVERGAIAAIDLHNNTGNNPRYSVLCSLDRHTLGLAALFSHRAVYFRGIPGTQTASFRGLLPAITAECGQAGEASNIRAAAQLLDATIKLRALEELENVEISELYHTLGVVRVRDDLLFAFGSDDSELSLDPAIDEKNFRELEPGTIFGESVHPAPLRMLDEAGRDVTEEYFEVKNGKLMLRKKAVPAMFTLDTKAVRQDCLCYLMERF